MTFEQQMDQVQADYEAATEKTLLAEVERLKAAGLTEEEAGQMTGVKYIKWLKKLEAQQG